MGSPKLTTLIATLFALVVAGTLAVAGLVLDRALGPEHDDRLSAVTADSGA